MKLYLAGPMTGIPYFNFPAFMKAARMLRDLGHEVFNPAENDINKAGRDFFVDCPTGREEQIESTVGFTRRQALADDMAFICLEAEGIALLPGWSRSSGACAERATAIALGLTVIHLYQQKDHPTRD
ncbi:MAG: DUF4406 domain-containing protein [Pirellulales bacterium]